MCDASCEKYTFLEVKEAEEKARFDFDCREEVLGAGNHICYEDAAEASVESIFISQFEICWKFFKIISKEEN